MPTRYRPLRFTLSVTFLVVVFMGKLSPELQLGVFYLAPAFLLLIPLYARCFIGEEQIEQLRNAVAARKQRSWQNKALAKRIDMAFPAAPSNCLVRGGLLLATALATRPPPRKTVAAIH